jgi:inosose dehydratase
MNRREFVKRAAMVSAVVAGGGFAGFGCAKPAQPIRWSMGWILWRDYRKTTIPLTEAINHISALGLDGIEYTPRPDELSRNGFTRESFRDFLAEKNLSIAGNYFGADFHNPGKHADILLAFHDTLENLKFYGAKNVVIGPPGRGDESEIPGKIRIMAPFLNELGKIAIDAGMEIGLHPHVNTIVETPSEIDMIMELTDPRYVGMAPDTGHIDLGGGKSLEIIRKYSSRLNYFHLKDVSGKFIRPNFGPNLRELGKGEVDFPGVMTLLKEVGFKGWLNVEQDNTELTPAESATQSMKYINTRLKPIYGDI